MNRCAASRKLLFQLPKVRCRVVASWYRRSEVRSWRIPIGRRCSTRSHVTMPANIDSGCAAAAFLSFRREVGVQYRALRTTLRLSSFSEYSYIPYNPFVIFINRSFFLSQYSLMFALFIPSLHCFLIKHYLKGTICKNYFLYSTRTHKHAV